MFKRFLITLMALLLLQSATWANDRAELTGHLAKMPLLFEENLGQHQDGIPFRIRGLGQGYGFTGDGFWIGIPQPDGTATRYVRVRFENANDHITFQPKKPCQNTHGLFQRQ